MACALILECDVLILYRHFLSSAFLLSSALALTILLFTPAVTTAQTCAFLFEKFSEKSKSIDDFISDASPIGQLVFKHLNLDTKSSVKFEVSIDVLSQAQSIGPVDGPGWSQLKKSSRAVAIGTQRAGVAQGQIVLNWGAGFDAATLFQVTPSAQIAVGVDSNPFIWSKTRGPRPEYFQSYLNTPFSHWSLVQNTSSLAEATLFRLADSVANFRLLGVWIVPGARLAVHGVIAFDSGPNTELRLYVHLNESIGGSAPTEALWSRMLHQVDTFIVKGSMGMLRHANEKNVFASPDIDAVIAALAKNGGTIVDGDGLDWNWSLLSPTLRAPPRAVPLGESLGYGRTSLYVFKKDSYNRP